MGFGLFAILSALRLRAGPDIKRVEIEKAYFLRDIDGLMADCGGPKRADPSNQPDLLSNFGDKEDDGRN
jgi:hypothetical protein